MLQKNMSIINTNSIIILGPTASGKTRLAVSLAKKVDGEIISADSRQVYRGMDIGTGKDLEEYNTIPYHLINHRKAGEQYDAQKFIVDATQKIKEIQERKATPIICGGTGLYLHGLILGMPYSWVPQFPDLRKDLEQRSLIELQKILAEIKLPGDYKADPSSRKKCIRAIEIGTWYATSDPDKISLKKDIPISDPAQFLIFGIDIPQPVRRRKITERLERRIEEGLVEECERLLDEGLTHEQLQYYGLEYKYCSLLLSGKLDQQEFFSKLNTEIHRFARRQMTFFRKMEKDGIRINWLPYHENGPDVSVQAILNVISEN